MIEVAEQYVLNIYVKGQDKLIDDKDLIDLTIVEYAGLRLPMYEMRIVIHDRNHLSYFNENNILCMQIGRTKNDIYDIELTMKIVKESEVQKNITHVTLKGFINMQNYLITTKKRGFEGTSYEVMNEIMSSGYGLKGFTNISNTKDKMKWLQRNISDYAFMNEVWQHNYIKDYAFLYTCVNIRGEFHMLDIVQSIKNRDIPFTLTSTKPEYAYQTQISTDYRVDNSTALSNMKSGYVKSMDIYNQGTREYETITIDDKRPIVSESNVQNADTSISKSDGFKILTPLMHKNYYKAEMYNMNRLFAFDSSKLWVSIEDKYTDIHPIRLANVLLKEDEQSCVQHSGLYMVARVVRQIKNKRMTTNVLLCRESFNYQR